MTASELLKAATKEIRKRGWTTDTLQDPEGRVCAIGAMNAVLNGDPEDFSSTRTLSAACKRIVKAIGDDSDNDPINVIVDWNNEDCKSAAGCIQMFQRAAQLK